METSQYLEEFIDTISETGRLFVTRQEVGVLVTEFPVAGGGRGCIVIMADGLLVRLTEQGTVWLAEELIARGGV